jgi:hypothetical protein
VVASGPEVQVDPAALELELVDLALAVVVAAGLEGEDLQVAGEVLELGQQFSYGHPTQRSAPSAVRGLDPGGDGTIGPAGNRAWNRGRACAVGAVRRGQPHAPGTPVVALGRGRVVRNSGELRPRHRTAPSLQACWLAVTLSNENARSRFRTCPTAPAGLRAAAGR